MAIDATILHVEREGGDVVLTLGPRIDNDDRLSISGQSKLRILRATYEPPVGADIWGGDSMVELVVQPRRRYRRVSYVQLVEDFVNAL